MGKKKSGYSDYLAGWKAIPPKPHRKEMRGKPVFKFGSKPDSFFDARQLRMGVRVEREHTDSAFLAKQIVKAHLMEDSAYYDKLKRAGL